MIVIPRFSPQPRLPWLRPALMRRRLLSALLVVVALLATATPLAAQPRLAESEVDLYEIDASITNTGDTRLTPVFLSFHNTSTSVADVDVATGQDFNFEVTALSGAQTVLITSRQNFDRMTEGIATGESAPVTFLLPFSAEFRTISFFTTNIDTGEVLIGSAPWDNPREIEPITVQLGEAGVEVTFEVEYRPAGFSPLVPPTPEELAVDAVEEALDSLRFDVSDDMSAYHQEPELTLPLMALARNPPLSGQSLVPRASMVEAIDPDTVTVEFVNIELGELVTGTFVRSGDVFQLTTESFCALANLYGPFCQGSPLTPVADLCAAAAGTSFECDQPTVTELRDGIVRLLGGSVDTLDETASLIDDPEAARPYLEAIYEQRDAEGVEFDSGTLRPDIDGAVSATFMLRIVDVVFFGDLRFQVVDGGWLTTSDELCEFALEFAAVSTCEEPTDPPPPVEVPELVEGSAAAALQTFLDGSVSDYDAVAPFLQDPEVVRPLVVLLGQARDRLGWELNATPGVVDGNVTVVPVLLDGVQQTTVALVSDGTNWQIPTRTVCGFASLTGGTVCTGEPPVPVDDLCAAAVGTLLECA